MKLRIGAAVGLVVLAAATAVGVIVMRGSGGGSAVPVPVTFAPTIAMPTPAPSLGDDTPNPATPAALRRGGIRCGALWNTTMTRGAPDSVGQSLYRQALAGLDPGSPPILLAAVRRNNDGGCQVLLQAAEANPPPAYTKALDCEIDRATFGCGEIRPLPALGSGRWAWFELKADGSLSAPAA